MTDHSSLSGELTHQGTDVCTAHLLLTNVAKPPTMTNCVCQKTVMYGVLRRARDNWKSLCSWQVVGSNQSDTKVSTLNSLWNAMFYTSWHPNWKAPVPEKHTTAVSNHQEGIWEIHMYMSVSFHTNTEKAWEGFSTDFIFYLSAFCDRQSIPLLVTLLMGFKCCSMCLAYDITQ